MTRTFVAGIVAVLLLFTLAPAHASPMFTILPIPTTCAGLQTLLGCEVDIFAADDTFNPGCVEIYNGCPACHSAVFSERSNDYVKDVFTATATTQNITELTKNGGTFTAINGLILFTSPAAGGSAPELNAQASVLPVAAVLGLLAIALERRPRRTF